MKPERGWQVQSSHAVRQEADRLGLVQESWEIVKMLPSVPLTSFEDIDVSGTVGCHQCGKAIPFNKRFTWGMLGGSTLTCPHCNVDISMGAYDAESGAAKPLWVYAAPFTEHSSPEHRNSVTIQSIDGFPTTSGGTTPQTGSTSGVRELSDHGVAPTMRQEHSMTTPNGNQTSGSSQSSKPDLDKASLDALSQELGSMLSMYAKFTAIEQSAQQLFSAAGVGNPFPKTNEPTLTDEVHARALQIVAELARRDSPEAVRVLSTVFTRSSLECRLSALRAFAQMKTPAAKKAIARRCGWFSRACTEEKTLAKQLLA